MNYKILFDHFNVYKILGITLIGFTFGVFFSYIYPIRTVVTAIVYNEFLNEPIISLINVKLLIDSSDFIQRVAEELSDPELPLRFNPNIGGRYNTYYDKNSSTLNISIAEDTVEKSEFELRKILSDISLVFIERKIFLSNQLDENFKTYIDHSFDEKEINSLNAAIDYYFFKFEKQSFATEINKRKLLLINGNAPSLLTFNKPMVSTYARSAKFAFIFGSLFLITGIWVLLLIDYKLRRDAELINSGT